jgi:hypothetical protein
LRPQRSIQKFFAFLLILSLSQAAGINFFLHSKFHITKTAVAKTSGSTSIQFNCSCTDDFHMPFEKAEDQPMIQSIQQFAVIEIAPVDATQLQQHFTQQLRGPPAFHA